MAKRWYTYCKSVKGNRLLNFSEGKNMFQGDFWKDIMDKTIFEVVFEY